MRRERCGGAVVVRVNGNRVRLKPAVKSRGVYVTAERVVAADPA